MKRKAIFAMVAVVLLIVGTIGALALNSNAPEDALSVTARFFEVESNEAGTEFTMETEDGEYVIHVTDDTAIYFEDYVPMSDECDEVTKDVREVLFGRTLVEVLDGRNMVVTFADNKALSITILFETAVHLPAEALQGNDGYATAVTLPAEVDWDEFGPVFLNGEIVVNGEFVASAAVPFVDEATGIVMAPLRAVAEALDFEVNWDGTLRSIRIGVANYIWIGNTEAQVGRAAPIELSAAPAIINGVTFVPIDFFRSVLSQTAYVFEGQFVVETYSDMH